MRLWHSKLIPLLDGRRLCDLHMSCCNLRGKGWGKRNAAVGYLYEDPLGEDALTVYHHAVLKEMDARGYHFDVNWLNTQYCGKQRPLRAWNPQNYRTALWRNVPLLGHTLEIYMNDVATLKERGLDIQVISYSEWEGHLHSKVFCASRGGIETQYIVKL